MALDNEQRLVSKVIKERVIIPVIEQGIKDDWFVDDDLRRVWKFIREHYANYRVVPTAETVKDNFPNFTIYNIEESMDYLIDTMVTFRRNLLTRNGLQDVMLKMSQNDHESALTEMSKTVTNVNAQGVVGTTHVNLTENTDKRFEEYENLQNNKLLGIATGFSKIDEATSGLQGGQLITIIAPPKTGKSQIALQMAVNVHATGMTPMFQSFEMNNHEQSQRHDAIRAHLSATRFRNGKLQRLEEERYKELLTNMKTEHPFHLVDAMGGLTIDALVAKVEQLNPDIVFVDGVYLMLDQITGEANSPQALTNITRGLKRVAQKMDIPIVITTQTLLWKMKGGKVSADSIGYSSSFFQDSDVILGLEPIEEEEKQRLLKIVQSRNCPPSGEEITWDWETGCFHDKQKSKTCKYCTPWSI
ncbi:DnaB Replicative DNA helicase [uncultured Caudovirales phage]|uniref:DnaB Replicative DNA helicase n=1 Tax=uncultured Caudovirales phage TaxID=2100421 RepID=A0A6J5MQR1_9CAUD|nr:DnaB Replicative DNA helicase [uncultured Caudovirales phage]CAB4148087.1 DnaB Replicative DNA helicase [uncultured Caudovirales phage]